MPLYIWRAWLPLIDTVIIHCPTSRCPYILMSFPALSIFVHESSIIPSQRPLWQQTDERNNGFKKPFSFQTVSKYYQRCVTVMEKPETELSLPGESLGSCSLQCRYHQELQQGALRTTFMKSLQGKTFWNVITGSSYDCRGCSLRAPCSQGTCRSPACSLRRPGDGCCPCGTARPPSAEQPSQGCPSCAPKPCTSQDWTFIVKPCCQEENLFWGNERITTQLLICHDPVLHWGDCWLELSYCALRGVDVIRTRL